MLSRARNPMALGWHRLDGPANRVDGNPHNAVFLDPAGGLVWLTRSPELRLSPINLSNFPSIDNAPVHLHRRHFNHR